MKKRKFEIEVWFFLVVLIIMVAIVLLSGCSSRNAKVILPDGTEVHYNMAEILQDKRIAEIEIDLKTGTLHVKKFDSSTSPVVADIIRAIYEAGVLAGTMK